MITASWLTEFLLEVVGAWAFARRREKVIGSWLAFRAAADILCFALLKFAGYDAYTWGDYIQRTLQYGIFAVVAIYTVGKILREAPQTKKAYTVAGVAAVVIAVIRLHSVWPPSAAAVNSLEAWVQLILAAFVAAAMGNVNGRPPQPWGLIACALIVMGGSNGLITLGRQNGLQLEAWYPAGAIAGLALLVWSGWRDYRLEDFRMPLGKKKPATMNVTWLQRVQA